MFLQNTLLLEFCQVLQGWYTVGMTVEEWLKEAAQQLAAADVGTARLDALVLLEDALRTDRAQLLARPETKLTTEQQSLLGKQLLRRARHEPLAYIRGKTEFYGRDFFVSPAVLEPRPESETMIELLKKLPVEARKTVVDVGTGSGALAITAATELTAVQVIATDIDPACLMVARQNCKLHAATVDLRETNLINDVILPKDTVILANLPYVPDDYEINQAASSEPRLAIFGGPDGLNLYRELFVQLVQQEYPASYVLTESLPFQHEDLAAVAKKHGYTVLQSEDFIQVFQL